jgi:hypothetical protein
MIPADAIHPSHLERPPPPLSYRPCAAPADHLKTKIILELNGKMKKQDAPLKLLANLKQGGRFVVNGAFTSLSELPPASAEDIAIHTMISPMYWVRILSVK